MSIDNCRQNIPSQRPPIKHRFGKQLADGSAKLSVQDHGEGIAARHLPSYYRNGFYRVDKGAFLEILVATGLGALHC